jgi:hypothetical protein
LEKLPGLMFLACADDTAATTHQEDGCDTDSCASVESGFYKIEDAGQVVPMPPLIPSAFLTATMLEAARPAVFQSVIFDFAPTELPRLWQFSQRTALPPRAPSFVS